MRTSASSLSAMAISVRSASVLQAGGDPQLLEAGELAKASGRPLQIRMNLQLKVAGSKSYAGWRDTSWTVSVSGAEEAELVKDALQAFFGAVATGRLGELTEVLSEFGGGR